MPRGRYRRSSPWAAIAVLALLAWIGFRAWQEWREGDNQPPVELQPGAYSVERVVDGDTLLLEGGARVRLLGVDTPETVKPNTPVQPFGPEASKFAKQFIGKQQVRLEFDRERKDHYGRFLAYVFVDGPTGNDRTRGETMLNEELLRAGLGKFLPQYRYSSVMKKRFEKAQLEAQAARRGIWSVEEPKAKPATKSSRKYAS